MPCHQNRQSGVDQWNQRQTSGSQTWFQSRKWIFTIYFNYAGRSVVNILPRNTTVTGDHYTGTILAKVVATVQEQRPNMGIARTLLLHDNAAPHKARVTISMSRETISMLRETSYMSWPTQPAPLTWHHATLCCFLLWKLALLQRIVFEVNTLQKWQIHSFMCNTIQKWLRQLQLCVDNNGKCFENPCSLL